jgi:hypothetical protein
MLIYFVLLAVVIACAAIAMRIRELTTVALAAAFIAMVLFAGLRDQQVGTDGKQYVRVFEKMEYFNNIWDSDMEPAFMAFNWCFRHFTDQYVYLFLALASVFVGCFMFSIVRFSVDWEIALFSLIVCGIYTFGFNGIRQGMACAIYSLAIGALFQRSLWRHTAIGLCASLFHISALATIPAYFLTRPTAADSQTIGMGDAQDCLPVIQANSRSALRSYLLIATLGIMAAVLLRLFAGLFAESLSQTDLPSRYSSYLQSNIYSSGRIITAFNVLVCLFFLWFRQHVFEGRWEYEILLKQFFLGTVIEVVSSLLGMNPSGIRRVSLYFTFTVVFLWPLVFYNLRQSRNRWIFAFFFIVGYLVFYTVMLQRFSDLVPYRFNTSIFS